MKVSLVIFISGYFFVKADFSWEKKKEEEEEEALLRPITRSEERSLQLIFHFLLFPEIFLFD